MRRILGAVLAGLLLCSCAARKEQPVQTEQNTETLAEATIASRSEKMTEPEQEAYFAHSMLLEPKDTDFVRIRDYIPDVIVELKYAGQDNFTGQTIYEFEDAFLRYGSVMKLREVCRELREMGYRLKIWDGFRPVGAQFRLWEVCPDPNFVANPNVGFSNHSRGNALDITLVDAADAELVMPSGFDDFSARADRDYSDCTPEAADNARLLESVMEKHGFSGYWGEWWHYADTQKYEVETCFDPARISPQRLTASTPLYTMPSQEAGEILTIPEGAQVWLLGYDGGFALVGYWGYRGYLPAEALQLPLAKDPTE